MLLHPDAPGKTRCVEQLSRSLKRIADHYPWGSATLGFHDADDPWLTLEDLAQSACIDRLIGRMQKEESEYRDTQEMVLGNYLFRAILSMPLLVAGYLFIAERRMLSFAEIVAYRDIPWLRHIFLLEPSLFVLAEDELAGEPSVHITSDLDTLADTLFAEVDRAFGPILSAFESRRFVAPASAWGSMLDALAEGMLTAGRSGLPMDEAWRRWEELIAKRRFPVRRRPKRFVCNVDGVRHEYAIRAGCCLYFMTPSAKRNEHPTCTTCYLTSDQERMEILEPYLRKLASEKDQGLSDGDG